MSDVANVLLKLLDVANPLAGTVAEFVAGKLGLSQNTIEAVQQSVAGADPVKLKQIAADLQDHLAGYGVQIQIAQIDAQARQVVAVNATLQADAKSGSWLAENHHAIESMATVALVIAVYFVLPLNAIPVPVIPSDAFLMLGAILGVTAWQRGEVKQIAENNKGS